MHIFFTHKGSMAVHEQAPLTKYMLLADPGGTGKMMLVQTDCNEVGADMLTFQLSIQPANNASSAHLSGL